MKIWNYVFMGITMMLFFEFTGFQTAVSGVFTFFNIGITDGIITTFNFSLSNFMSYLFAGVIDAFTSTSGLLSVIIGGGITAGLFYSGKPEIAIKAGLAGVVFAGFISTLYFPLTKAIEIGVAPWALGVLALVFVPFTIGFGFALLEYILGGNTD